MPQGQPLVVPQDGLTTKARRNAPILAVHTGAGKGKSTAAFGMALRAWHHGADVAVFQFVKSAKWRVGEESVFGELAKLHDEHGIGGSVQWHKMGSGWSWSRKAGTETDHAATRQLGGPKSHGGWQRRSTASTCWMSSPIRSSGDGSTRTKLSRCCAPGSACNTWSSPGVTHRSSCWTRPIW